MWGTIVPQGFILLSSIPNVTGNSCEALHADDNFESDFILLIFSAVGHEQSAKAERIKRNYSSAFSMMEMTCSLVALQIHSEAVLLITRSFICSIS